MTRNEIMTHLKLAAICAVILRSSSMVSAIQDLLMKWKTKKREENENIILLINL